MPAEPIDRSVPRGFKKRIAIACDRCNQAKAKCDGQSPCSRCIELKIDCSYIRTRKKRGKPPGLSNINKSTSSGFNLPSSSSSSASSPTTYIHSHERSLQSPTQNQSYVSIAPDYPHTIEQSQIESSKSQIINVNPAAYSPAWGHSNSSSNTPIHVPPLTSPQPLPYRTESIRSTSIGPLLAPIPPFQSTKQPSTSSFSPHSAKSVLSTEFHDNKRKLLPPHGQMMLPTFSPGPWSHTHPLSSYSVTNPFIPTTMYRTDLLPPQLTFKPDRTTPQQKISKYPILDTIRDSLPIVIDLADALLEEYFNQSPYVVGYCVRRRSILSPNPRRTSISLLYAFLWIGSLTCDHRILTTPASNRAIVSHQLMQLCVWYLPPLGKDNHSLDDIMTYTALGTVVSTTESKGDSLQWLNIALWLARQTLLNVEVEDLYEEDMEERRRTWWSLYCFDRHLALCFNRPLALFDFDCLDLYHPCDEAIWQSENELDLPPFSRCKGLTFEVQGSGFFGFFIPLMTILGNVVEVHFNNHNATLDYGSQTCIKDQVIHQLETFGKSLSLWTRTQNIAWVYYAEQILHTLYILLHGHMDVISMIEDTGDWISSSDFVVATEHAVSAAETVTNILNEDPDLSFMPLPFGIYLFQGSFPLFLIIDKLENHATPDVTRACETIVRALEVCIVALDNQYQRNFRKVLRSCLDKAKHKGAIVDPQKAQLAKQRRKELLALYRWSGHGRGIIV